MNMPRRDAKVKVAEWNAGNNTGKDNDRHGMLDNRQREEGTPA